VIKNLIKVTHALEIPFVGKMTRHRWTKFISGKLIGTVTSGHPTRTTFGNTLRVLAMHKWFAHVARIPEGHIKHLISGDDSLIITTAEHSTEYVRVMSDLTSADTLPKVQGIGYVIKSTRPHPHIINFLSKVGSYKCTGTSFTR